MSEKDLTTQHFRISIRQSSNNENYVNDLANQEEGSVVTTSKPKKYNQQLGEFEKLNVMTSSDTYSDDGPHSNGTAGRIVRLYDFSDDYPIHFRTMWDIQKELVDGHVQRLKVEFQKKVPDTQFWSMDDAPWYYKGQNNSNESLFDVIPLSQRNIGRDVIIFLSHEPVYTLGTASDENYIKSFDDTFDVVRIERGGEVTYHGTNMKHFHHTTFFILADLTCPQYVTNVKGPGQLTVYPIIDLRSYNQDIHWYMRALEESILLALKNIGINDVSKFVYVFKRYY